MPCFDFTRPTHYMTLTYLNTRSVSYSFRKKVNIVPYLIRTLPVGNNQKTNIAEAETRADKMNNQHLMDFGAYTALGCASMFCGSAYYVNFVQMPAMRAVKDTKAVRELWKEMFLRAKKYQVGVWWWWGGGRHKPGKHVHTRGLYTYICSNIIFIGFSQIFCQGLHAYSFVIKNKIN